MSQLTTEWTDESILHRRPAAKSTQPSLRPDTPSPFITSSQSAGHDAIQNVNCVKYTHKWTEWPAYYLRKDARSLSIELVAPTPSLREDQLS
jgi:hypothetical protein